MSYCVTDGDEPAKAPEAKKKDAWYSWENDWYDHNDYTEDA